MVRLHPARWDRHGPWRYRAGRPQLPQGRLRFRLLAQRVAHMWAQCRNKRKYAPTVAPEARRIKARSEVKRTPGDAKKNSTNPGGVAEIRTMVRCNSVF